MEYTVKKLAGLAGVSTRTIRYYDEIGLLKPARINSSGYRIYGTREVDRLQQILFYRELGVSLESIQNIVTSPSFDGIRALKEHHQKLLEKKEQLNQLIANVEKTLAVSEGGKTMSDKEKFDGFKQTLLDENERLYGKEIREKYGRDAVNKSNRKLKEMTKEEYNELTKLEEELKNKLAAAFQTGDPSGKTAQEAAYLHRKWLSFYWESYSPKAHAGLAQMYVEDERFTAYYDKEQPGTAKFLRDAILIYTGKIL